MGQGGSRLSRAGGSRFTHRPPEGFLWRGPWSEGPHGPKPGTPEKRRNPEKKPGGSVFARGLGRLTTLYIVKTEIQLNVKKREHEGVQEPLALRRSPSHPQGETLERRICFHLPSPILFDLRLKSFYRFGYGQRRATHAHDGAVSPH
jgi:hypothetical protein